MASQSNEDEILVEFEKLMKDRESDISKIIQAAWLISCSRCILRILYVQNLITKSEKILENILVKFVEKHSEKLDQNRVMHDGKFICSGCVGLLQDELVGNPNGSLSISVISQLNQCETQFKDFSLALSIPPALQIRQFSVWFYLREKTGQFQTDVPQILEIKEVLKWILGGIISREKGLTFKFQSDFTVNVTLKNPSTQNEHLFLQKMKESEGMAKRKQARGKRNAEGETKGEEISIKYVGKLLEGITYDKFKQFSPIPPPTVTGQSTFSISLNHSPVYVAGRYIKLSRNLSQSPWVIDGQRKGDNSVEELITAPISPPFKADSTKFLSAGREDIDVRMLGRGRPFVLELSNPKIISLSQEKLTELEEGMNSEKNPTSSMLKVVDLQMVNKNEVAKMKEGEQTKTKNYRALVWISKKVTESDLKFLRELKDMVIEQKTPVRVLHRRSLMVRKKTIHSLDFEIIHDNFIHLHLHTEAGTYIKEFVHSDLGRTHPSFTSMLGCQTDILELDVTQVNLDFPPSISTNIPTPPPVEIPEYLLNAIKE